MLFIYGILTALATTGSCATPTATIEIGVLQGTQTSLPSATAPVNKFLGIPYAQTPPLRFGPPAAAAKLTQPLNVSAWKPACIQDFPYPIIAQGFAEGVFNQPTPSESEDCLYINVYAPSPPAPAGGRAVLFWIYGGALIFGHAGQPAYDGSAFAAYQDVIVVTFNYRTNVFGFPVTPQIPLNQTNPGFLDQHFALDWVQRNIGAFGGNKNKVTIFGQSAGAVSIDALLTSYPNNAPFRAAILESGQTSYLPVATTSDPIASWNTLIQKLNCASSANVLACARAANAQTIQNIVETNSLSFGPIPDNGNTLVTSPAKTRATGKFAKVPVLAGTTAQEARVFAVGQTNFTAYLQTTFGATAPQVIPKLQAAFPVGTVDGVNTDYDRVAQVFTLLAFQCTAAFMTNATEGQGVPVWRYYYNSSFPNIAYTVPFVPSSGVWHTSEIQEVFQTYPGGPINPQTPWPSGFTRTDLPPTAQEETLSSFMNGAWATFAKNPQAGPGWNQLGDASGRDLGVLGGPAAAQTGVTVVQQATVDSQCALLLPQYRAVNPGVFIPSLA